MNFLKKFLNYDKEKQKEEEFIKMTMVDPSFWNVTTQSINYQDTYYFNDDEEFLAKLVAIVTGGKELAKPINFNDCIKSLVDNKYLVFEDDNTDLFDLLNDSFDLHLDKEDFTKNLNEKYEKYKEYYEKNLHLKKKLMEVEMYELLESKGLGVIVLFSLQENMKTSSSYGVFKLEVIEEIKELFKDIEPKDDGKDYSEFVEYI